MKDKRKLGGKRQREEGRGTDQREGRGKVKGEGQREERSIICGTAEGMELSLDIDSGP